VSDVLRLLAALLVAAAAAYSFTPVAIRAAARFDFYDKPRGYKGHATATPYLGGSAVLAAFLMALLLLAGDLGRTAPIVAGTATLWAVGTIDDRRHVSPGVRVLIEFGLAAMLWATGLGWDLGLGSAVNLGATCFWGIAVVNAINLFDNMDGASSTMACVVGGAIGVLGSIDGDAWLTAAGAALAGSCLGFLPYNLARPNARIFLGDGGSMPVGFAVAALVMIGVSDAVAAWQALVLGLMLVGIPALDTALVIISRQRKGISILTGGRDHLTHRTRRRLATARAVALTLGAVQALVASIALVAVSGGPIIVVAITAGFLAAAGGIIAYLEREEDRLHVAGELYVPTEAVQKAEERRARRPDPYTVGDIALVILGLGAGISPLFFGFYDTSLWVPIGLGLIVVVAMGAIRRPPDLTRRGWAVLGAVVGFGLVSVLSSGWAESASQATVDGNRWLVLAAVLGLALILVRSTRRELTALGALGAGILLIAGIVIVRMLGAGGPDVFLGGRLNQPLGYINAEATVFIMGLWLSFAVIERRQAVVAGVGVTCATWAAGLTLLSQSRGAALAVLVSLLVVVGALPGRRRRVYALLVIGVSLLAARGALLDVYATQAATGVAPAKGIVHHAALVLILSGVIAGIVWGAVVHAHDRVLSDNARRIVDRAGRAILVVGAVVALIGAAATSGRISDRLNAQWDAFTLSEPSASVVPAADSSSRLASGAGNRYDYWRVAWHAFQDHPAKGLGAGNFGQAWFANRAVAEDVRQPHSLELQLLSELGLLGAALLAVFLAGLGVAIVRIRRVATPGTASGGVAVAAVGVIIAWLVHTSVDWQHLLPGVTAAPLLAMGVLLRSRKELGDGLQSSRVRSSRLRQIALAVGIGAIVAVTGALLTRQGLADHYRARAFEALASNPTRAIVEADRSLRLDGDAVRSYYAKAAALARLDRAVDADAALQEAIRREPRNSVTWALRGDLATRRGQTDDARLFYGRALTLNPLDPGLRQLVGPPPPPVSP
jgi:UDP-N-acetylmuramyl pentapeptide phosphotransferase/UDP-N-acetylglucosamine-1-phosphate transferase